MVKRRRPATNEAERMKRKEKLAQSLLTIIIILTFLLCISLLPRAMADEIIHQFKSPSFSGIATSSHYLTIENQEFNRKEAIRLEMKAYQEELEREAENTTLARFIRNLESRIYAQLSRQLVDNLFGEVQSESGVLELEGNRIEYEVSEDGSTISLTITDSDGNTTEITIPIGSFSF